MTFAEKKQPRWCKKWQFQAWDCTFSFALLLQLFVRMWVHGRRQTRWSREQMMTLWQWTASSVLVEGGGEWFSWGYEAQENLFLIYTYKIRISLTHCKPIFPYAPCWPVFFWGGVFSKAPRMVRSHWFLCFIGPARDRSFTEEPDCSGIVNVRGIMETREPHDLRKALPLEPFAFLG